MKKLLLLLLLFPTASLFAEDNIITKESVKEYANGAQFLIDHLDKQRDKFCKSTSVSGIATMTGSIRVSSGKQCSFLLGAALANAVCDKAPDVDEFSKSQCKTKMNAVFTNNTVKSVIEKDPQIFTWSETPKTAKTALAFIIKQRGAEKVCAAIDAFYNVGKSECISGIKSKIPLQVKK